MGSFDATPRTDTPPNGSGGGGDRSSTHAHSHAHSHAHVHQVQQQQTAHGRGQPSFPLLSIFFAEFDNTVGPKITCQAPEGFLSDDMFDSISDFMITGPELRHKLVTVHAFEYTIIGYPMSLQHKKYHRNALLFNVAFVFPRDVHGYTAKLEAMQAAQSEGKDASSAAGPPSSSSSFYTHSHPASSAQSTPAQLRPYHSVIRKLATIIEGLEVESEFLFRPESKRLLQGLVSRVLRNLNKYGECSVTLETSVKEAAKEAQAQASASASSAAVAGASAASHSTAAQSKGATALAAPATSSGASGGSSFLARHASDEGPITAASSAAGSTASGALGSIAPPSSSAHAPAFGGGGGSGWTGASGVSGSSGGGSNGGVGSGVHKISLKLYPLLSPPPRTIHPWLVPLPVKDLAARWKPEWDLTLRQVIPFCDGVNFVSRISTLSGIHPSLVSRCLRQLLYYEALKMVDIFQFSNRYEGTDLLGRSVCTLSSSGGGGEAGEEERLRAERLRKDMRRMARLDPSRPKPKFSLLFRILTACNRNVTLGEVLKNLHTLDPAAAAAAAVAATSAANGSSHSVSPPPPPLTLESSNIHPRKFIQFAVINGLIRRVYLYPMLVDRYLGQGGGGGGGGMGSVVEGGGTGSGGSNSAASMQQLLQSPSLGSINGAASSSSSPPPPLPQVPSSSANGSALVDLSFLGVIHGRQNHVEDALFRHNAQMRARSATARTRNDPEYAASIASSAQGKGMFRCGSGTLNGGADGVSAGTGATGNSGGGGGLLRRESSAAHHAHAEHGDSLGAPTLPSSASLQSLVRGSSSGAAGGSAGATSTAPSFSFRMLERYLDGEHHYDELCCLFGRSFAQMDEEVKRSRRCVVIAK